MTRNASRWIDMAVIAVVILAVYHSILDLGHLGWDTWPLIAASRITSAADLFGTFTEELMGGFYRDGHFYRPLVHFSFALDWFVWGERAVGYHLTDLAILFANAILIARLVRVLFWTESNVAPLVAALFFVLHPVQMDVLPVSARRADSMCLAFTLAAVIVHVRGDKNASLLAAPLALLAVASKETGLLLAPLLIVSELIFSDGSARARVKSAFQRAVPTLIALGVFMLVRTLVLGGLGGHDETGVTSVFTNAFTFATAYAQRIFVPFGRPFGSDPITAGCVVAVVFAALLALGAYREREWRTPVLFLIAWLFLVHLISVASGGIESWYAMAFVAVLAPLVGMLAQSIWTSCAKRQYAGGVPQLIALFIVVVAPLSTSLPLRPQPEWKIASRNTASFLANLDVSLRGASTGMRLDGGRIPLVLTLRSDRGDRTISVLAVYSVEAWTTIFHPGRAVHVRLKSSPAPGPDVVDVVLSPLAMLVDEGKMEAARERD